MPQSHPEPAGADADCEMIRRRVDRHVPVLNRASAPADYETPWENHIAGGFEVLRIAARAELYLADRALLRLGKTRCLDLSRSLTGTVCAGLISHLPRLLG